MAVKYKLDEEARDQLDRRIRVGILACELADDGEESETQARDIVSDILTALFGPAGYCVPTGDEDSRPRIGYEVVLDNEKLALASAFLGLCQESWEGDAEDYTATAVTVDNPLLPSENRPTATSVRSVVTARYSEVQKQYEEEVEPGVSDNSVLEAERDTLGWVLDQLDIIEQGG